MDLSNKLAIASFVMSAPSGLIAWLEFAKKRRAAKLPASYLLLVCGLLASFGFWLLKSDAVKPQIVPCPALQQTGPATTQGDQSPANTGNGNQTNYGTAPATQKGRIK
jgi:hypothetical protein